SKWKPTTCPSSNTESTGRPEHSPPDHTPERPVTSRMVAGLNLCPLGGTLPTIHHGDCIETMNAMPPESIDAIVTDPPYGLGFMGKKWDGLPPSLEWAEACYRVLKPGGHIAAFGGTRTWHRLAVAIEDAGFEMRDSLAWLYGSGFPKSHDVGKAIDKLDASDERRARALEFTAFIRESGLTARRIDEITGTNMGGHFTTAASQPAIATADLFDML